MAPETYAVYVPMPQEFRYEDDSGKSPIEDVWRRLVYTTLSGSEIEIVDFVPYGKGRVELFDEAADDYGHVPGLGGLLDEWSEELAEIAAEMFEREAYPNDNPGQYIPRWWGW